MEDNVSFVDFLQLANQLDVNKTELYPSDVILDKGKVVLYRMFLEGVL